VDSAVIQESAVENSQICAALRLQRVASASVHKSLENERKSLSGQTPEPPPEAALIRSHREALTPPMSRRQAAAKAGISPSQWSDIERGTKKAGPGITVPVRATAETLAKMAHIVGASAAELASAGRGDAARELRDTSRDRLLRQRIAAIPGLGAIAGQAASTPAGHRELLPLIANGLDAIADSDLPAPAKQQLTSLFADNLRHDAARRYEELLLILRLAEGSQ
jgi:transcriptional regulator with XRE-family HTH domain